MLADLPAILSAPLIGGAEGYKVIAGPSAEKPEDLEAVAELAEGGALVPVIDQRFSFAHIAEAFRAVASGRKCGSVIVSLDARSAAKLAA